MALLQEKYKHRGFSVLAFPTNDFHQELGSNEEILEYVKLHFGSLNFPIFGLSNLEENAVYQALSKQLPDAHVQHNFFKYLVDRNGRAVQLFHKREDPMTLVEDIERLLEAGDGNKPRHKLVTE